MVWGIIIGIIAGLFSPIPLWANHFGLFFNPQSKRGIVQNGPSRNWNDGTFASSCGTYKNPTNPARYQYKGAIGDGYYTIDNGGGPVSTFCYMEPPSVTFVAGNNYVIRRKQPNTSVLQIYNLSTSTVFQDDIGSYLDGGNNTQVCYLPYENFILPAGATVQLDASCESLVLDVQGDLLVNGTVTARNSIAGVGGGGDYHTVDAAGVLHTRTLVQAAGGNGGSGGPASTVSIGSAPTPQGGAEWFGAGGGGAGGNAAVWYMCARSGGGGGSQRPQGPAGGGTNCNDTGFNSVGGSGGSGGAYGSHGQNLYIQVAGTYSGTGSVNASGVNGGNGSNGGGASCDAGWQLSSGGGGGGGGGAGGNGGQVFIRYKVLGPNQPTVAVNGGTGGAAGGGAGGCSGNGGTGFSGSSGQVGNPGSDGVYDLSSY